jgi:dipeptidyl-peptidase-3
MRFALRGGQVVPEAYRIGGLGSELIENVVYFLEQALPHAGSGSMKKSIEELIAFYRTGDEQAFRRHSIEWLKTGGNTDYINGFVEQLKDPRGVIGNFEGMAAFVSEAAVVERLASEVAFLEKNLPWPEQFKRQNPAKPVSNVATLLVGTGDMGPVPWAGYNLPNYEDIRSGMGSKNVVFINVMTSRSAQEQEAILKTFYLPEYRNTIQKWGDPTGKWEVVLHEIIGHGSGKADPGLKDDPRNIIGRSFSPLEEARADLVALYYVADKKLIEIGAYSGAGELDQDEIMLAAYVQYFQEFLILHRRFEGGTIKQAHWRGRQAILSYLLNGGDDGKEDFGIALVEEGGHYYVRIASAAKVRNGIAKLLAKIQTIKSMGDKAGAEALIDRLGTSYSQAVFDSVAARASALNLAKQKAFVFPRLQPVLDKKGNILDVKLLNDEDLTSQKLRFSRLAASRAIE